MRCEMCGKKGDSVSAIVEGVILKVCDNCAKYGDVIRVRPKDDIKREKKIEEPEIVELIVDDYSNKIKSAREKLKLKQEDLAKEIAEKESVIHALESGKMKPSLVLAKKLERFLDIKLIQDYEEKKGGKIDFKDKDVTIGDLLKIGKK